MSPWSPAGSVEWGGQPLLRRCADLVPRHRAVLRGTVSSVRQWRSLAGSPVTDAVLDDGTGDVVVRWLGRPTVPGVESGTALAVEGTVADVRGVLVVVNPLYELTSPADRRARRSVGTRRPDGS